MSKRPDFGMLYQRGNIWWIKYYKDGRPQYESSKSGKQSDAEKLLLERRAEMYNGTHLDSRQRKLSVGDLLDGLLRDYRKNGKKSCAWAEWIIGKHLRPEFGAMRMAKVQYDIVDGYIERRQQAGAANASINRELTLLRRSFNLAQEAGRIVVVPRLPKNLAENNVRKGFFERGPFVAVRAALPDPLKPVVTFAYWTGCRKTEILLLTWPQVDLIERVVRLEAGETKNDEARIIPLASELYEMLVMQKAIRDQSWPGCPWVFFRQGRCIKRFDDAWRMACKKAGVVDENGDPARIFHDLRRTGVRNLIRAGVPERVVMRISGHRSRTVFERYNIVSESDLHDAARKLDRYIQAREPEADGYKMVTVPPSSPRAAACNMLN